MPQAYCTGCQDTVDVSTDGVCATGHLIRRPRNNQRRRRAQAAANRPARVSRTPRPPTQVPVLRTTGRLPFMDMFGFDESSQLPEIVTERTTRARPGVGTLPPPTVAPIGPAPAPSLFDLLPRLVDMERRKPSDNTGDLVERLWEATSEIETLDDSWTPDSRIRISEVANHRWWLIAAVIIGLIAVISAGVRSGRSSSDVADLVSQTDAVASALATVEQAQLIASQLADPATDGAALSEAAVALTAIDTRAREVASAGIALAGSDTLSGASSALIAAADLGTTAERRLGDALTYRLTFEQGFKLPELPDQLDNVAIADLGFELSVVVSDTERMIGQLPRDPSLDAHRQVTLAALAQIDTMSVDYIQALRSGDQLLAGAYAQAMRGIVTDLDTALNSTLADMSTQMSAAFSDYEAALRQAGAELSSGS